MEIKEIKTPLIFTTQSACFLRNCFAGGGGEVVAVEFGDVLGADFLGADCFAFELVGAVSKSFLIHLADHGECSGVFFDLTLGKVIEM